MTWTGNSDIAVEFIGDEEGMMRVVLARLSVSRRWGIGGDIKQTGTI